MKNNKFLKTLLMTSLAFILVACGSTSESSESSANPTEETTTTEATNETVTVEQENGAVDVPVNPQNVVVFDYGVADTIRALGKGDQIVGMIGNNAPEYIAEFANEKEQAGGGLKEPNLEAISQMQPDLIIISGRQADFYDQLSDIAPVIQLNPEYEGYWGNVTNQINTIAQIFDAEDLAQEKITELETQIADIKAKNEENPSTNLALITSSGSLSAFSSTSRFSFLIDTLGFTGVDSVDSSTHGQEISYEGIRELDPDRIFVINRDAAIGSGDAESATEILNNDVIADTAAAKNDQIYALDPNLWYLSGGGLESMQLQIDELQSLSLNE